MTTPSITETLSKLAASNPAAWAEYVKHVTKLYEGAVNNVVSADNDGNVRMVQGQLSVYHQMRKVVEAVEAKKGAHHGNSA